MQDTFSNQTHDLRFSEIMKILLRACVLAAVLVHTTHCTLQYQRTSNGTLTHSSNINRLAGLLLPSRKIPSESISSQVIRNDNIFSKFLPSEKRLRKRSGSGQRSLDEKAERKNIFFTLRVDEATLVQDEAIMISNLLVCLANGYDFNFKFDTMKGTKLGDFRVGDTILFIGVRLTVVLEDITYFTNMNDNMETMRDFARNVGNVAGAIINSKDKYNEHMREQYALPEVVGCSLTYFDDIYGTEAYIHNTGDVCDLVPSEEKEEEEKEPIPDFYFSHIPYDEFSSMKITMWGLYQRRTSATEWNKKVNSMKMGVCMQTYANDSGHLEYLKITDIQASRGSRLAATVIVVFALMHTLLLFI